MALTALYFAGTIVNWATDTQLTFPRLFFFFEKRRASVW